MPSMPLKTPRMIPDSWDHVNFEQFRGIVPGSPVTQILAVLLNKPESEVLLMDLNISEAFEKLAFLDTPVPQSVITKESDDQPLNLEAESIAQYEDMRLYAKQMKGPIEAPIPEDFAHYPVIFATYFQKPYDSDTVDKLIPDVEQMPCGPVIGTVQYYLKEMKRIDEKWAALFPTDDYTADQKAAGFPQMAEFFGHYGSLLFAERNSKWSRDEWCTKSVAEFKYFMLYLSREGKANKAYSDGQQQRAQSKVKKR